VKKRVSRTPYAQKWEQQEGGRGGEREDYNGSLVITIKPNAKATFGVHCRLFYIPQKK
jgi:hypothetical protein